MLEKFSSGSTYIYPRRVTAMNRLTVGNGFRRMSAQSSTSSVSDDAEISTLWRARLRRAEKITREPRSPEIPEAGLGRLAAAACLAVAISLLRAETPQAPALAPG